MSMSVPAPAANAAAAAAPAPGPAGAENSLAKCAERCKALLAEGNKTTTLRLRCLSHLQGFNDRDPNYSALSHQYTVIRSEDGKLEDLFEAVNFKLKLFPLFLAMGAASKAIMSITDPNGLEGRVDPCVAGIADHLDKVLNAVERILTQYRSKSGRLSALVSQFVFDKAKIDGAAQLAPAASALNASAAAAPAPSAAPSGGAGNVKK